MTEQINNGRWCIVANIKKEIPFGPGGEEMRSGTKLFKAGARVSIIGGYHGFCESIIVIGQHRKSGKFLHCTVKANVVENMRVKLIYRPQILEFLMNFEPEGARLIRTKEDAEECMVAYKYWAKHYC